MDAEAPRVHETLDINVVFRRSLDFGDVGRRLRPGRTTIIGRARGGTGWGRSRSRRPGAVAHWDPFGQSMTV